MWRAKTGWLFVLALAAFWDANQLAVEQDPYERVIKRAIALLPKQAGLVVVFDVDTAGPELKRTLLHLDSFVIKGRREIYLTKGSAVLSGALKGSSLYEHVLATIIWHEMAHLDGADERGARKAEQNLWTRFVRDQVCDDITALRYLRALAKRPDDQLAALYAETDVTAGLRPIR
jgi:hypothetical protein